MKKKLKYIVIIVLLIFLICFLYSCMISDYKGSSHIEGESIGDFIIDSNKREHVNDEEEVVDDTSYEGKYITYSGYGTYILDKSNPYIELYNPEGNFVDMIFTVSDKDNGEIICISDKVSSGEFLYVNVYDFYNEVGIYYINIDISSYSHANGDELNGMHEEAEVIIN